MQLQIMCNSILLTLEVLLSLLKETKTIGKNLGKIRARETGERELIRGRSPSTQEEVIVDEKAAYPPIFGTNGLVVVVIIASGLSSVSLMGSKFESI